jgi:hypothetical protein
VGDDELAGRVDGMGREIKRKRVKTVIGREVGIDRPGTEGVEGKFGSGEWVGPSVGREGDMTGRDDGNDVVFGGSNRPFRRESTMVLGGNVLEDERDREKVVGEVRGGLVVEEEMRDRVRKRGEKWNDRLVGGDVGNGAVFEWDEVDFSQVGHHQDIFEAVVWSDKKTSRQISRRPVRLGDGDGAGPGQLSEGWGGGIVHSG